VKFSIDWIQSVAKKAQIRLASNISKAVCINDVVTIDEFLKKDNSHANALIWLNHSGTKNNYSFNNYSNLVILVFDEVQWNQYSTGFSQHTIIFCANAKFLFLSIAHRLFMEELVYELSESASINPYSKIDRNVYIGSNCSLGACNIGAGSFLQSGVFVDDGIQIGKRVRLYSNASIGIDNFGFEFDRETDSWIKYPQIGSVRIGDDVVIGANTCIAKGILDDTVIEENVELDNLC